MPRRELVLRPDQREEDGPKKASSRAYSERALLTTKTKSQLPEAYQHTSKEKEH